MSRRVCECHLFRYDDVDGGLPATHWRDPGVASSARWAGRGGGVTSCEAVRMRRYSFLMSSSGLSSLQIAGLRAEDAGLYRCSTVLYCTALYCTVQVQGGLRAAADGHLVVPPHSRRCIFSYFSSY